MSDNARPNILYIHPHDTGRYIQPYGYGVATPNLQALAERGMLFRQAFCAGPTCSPSRAGLLTGQCAHSSGMVGLAHRGFSLHDYDQHLVHTLRRAGYRSTLIGVQHVVAEDEVGRIGYDRVVALETSHAEHVAPAAVDFLAGARSQPPRRALSPTSRPLLLRTGFTGERYAGPRTGPGRSSGSCWRPSVQ